MTHRYLIGLDFGTDSARGVLIDAASGDLLATHTHAYAHGVMSASLPDGTALPRDWALQEAADYTAAAAVILAALGRGRTVEAIGLGFTASSPLPATRDGEPLSARYPGEPHAYVKLWKHRAAQPYAEAINRRGGAFLDNFGGRLSGEWLLAKAAQIAEEAPAVWEATERFIEGGDWLVWQLTGVETRSLAFATYKAQYTQGIGYPEGVVSGLIDRLARPWPVGSAAGELSGEWRAHTGIEGPAVVAVGVIDSHAALPAVGAVAAGSLVGSLGTSAGYQYLNDAFQPLPPGIEGVAKDGSVRGLWCYEAGQAGFGDVLGWFVRTFPRGEDATASFAAYTEEAARIPPGSNRLVALDWWNGNRVPLADAGLSGVLAGMTTATTAAEIYRALMESLCFGARTVAELFQQGALPIERIIVTSGLARNNPLLVRIMAEVLGRELMVPAIDNATAVGAAIHGAVAAGRVSDFAEGAVRFGAESYIRYRPEPAHVEVYDALYASYRGLAESESVRDALHTLNRTASPPGR